jgi:hypothetical protein
MKFHRSGAAGLKSGQFNRKRNFVVLNLWFLIVGAVFNRDCPGKSRLKAAPTSH